MAVSVTATQDQIDQCRKDMGLVIHGGRFVDGVFTLSSSTFPNRSCEIPATLGAPFRGHSLSVLTSDDGSTTTLVSCAGEFVRDECWSWQKGDDAWQLFAKLDQDRFGQMPYAHGDRLLLIGGNAYNRNGTVTVMDDSTGIELPSGRVFNLNNWAHYSCLIPDEDTFILAGATHLSIGQNLPPIFGLVEKYSSTGEFIEYLPSLTPSDHNSVHYYACGTFEYGQGNKAYMVMSGWRTGGPEYEGATEVLFQHADAWVPGPAVPHTNTKPWTAYATVYNLTPDRLLMVYGPERDDNNNQYSEAFQLSPDGKSWTLVGEIGRVEFAAAVADLSALCD